MNSGETKFIGLTFDWDYAHNKVYMSLPGFIKNALKIFGYEILNKRQDQPHEHVPPLWSKTTVCEGGGCIYLTSA
ncbi:LOW QUALITY PROTEIN: hypothetical protein ACHAW6_009681 [Cyclotella cf. meneghiniana]